MEDLSLLIDAKDFQETAPTSFHICTRYTPPPRLNTILQGLVQMKCQIMAPNHGLALQ